MRGFTAAEMEKLLAKVGLATLIARYSDVILRLAKGRAGAHRDRAQNLGLHIVAHRHDAAPVARSPIVAIFRLVTSARNSPRAGPPTARGLTNSRTFIPSPNCLLIRRSAARDLQRRDPAGIGFVAVKLGSPLKVSRHSLQARLRCARDGKLTQNRLNSGPRVFQDREKFKVFLIIHRTPPNRRNALGAGALALRADARLGGPLSRRCPRRLRQSIYAVVRRGDQVSRSCPRSRRRESALLPRNWRALNYRCRN